MNLKEVSIIFIIFFLLLTLPASSQSDFSLKAGVPEGLNQVAPGDSLYFSIQLIKFEDNQTQDITLLYDVRDCENNTLLENKETIAIETTASLVRSVKIPPDFKPGTYYLVVEAVYSGQEFPALAIVRFEVLPTFFGMFLYELIPLFLIAVSTLIILLVLFLIYIRSVKKTFVKFDYSHIPKEKRPYFEILSKVISALRSHVGNKAIKCVNEIEGVKVSDEGKVLKIEKDPAEVLAILISKYQEIAKVSNAVDKLLQSEKNRRINKPVEDTLSHARDYIKLVKKLKRGDKNEEQ